MSFDLMVFYCRYEGYNVDLANALMEATNNTLKFNLEIWPSYVSAIGKFLVPVLLSYSHKTKTKAYLINGSKPSFPDFLIEQLLDV